MLGADGNKATPTGQVQVSIDDELLGAFDLENGNVSLTLPAQLDAGTHTLNVLYLGDEFYAEAGAEQDFSVAQTPATLDVTWPEDQTYGQIDETVDVTVSLDGAAPVDVTEPALDGVVDFLIDGESAGSVSLSEGDTDAQFTLPAALAVGTHTLSVVYAGNENVAAKTVVGAVTVQSAATTTTVSGLPASITYGDVLGFTVNVESTSGTPAGTVTATLGAVTREVELVEGSATFSLDTAGLSAIGELSLAVSYSGSVGYAASTSAKVPVTIGARATTVSVTSAGAGSSANLLDITAEVSADGLTPTGTVRFVLDGAQSVDIQLQGGTATFSIPATIADGDHRYTVVYVGSGGFAATQETSGSFTVSRAATAEASSTFGQPELSDWTPQAGTQQTLTLTGLTPGEVVYLYVYSSPIYLTSGTANASGVVTLQFTLPTSLEAGSHRLEYRTAEGTFSVPITVSAASSGSGTGGNAGSTQGAGSGSVPGTVPGVVTGNTATGNTGTGTKTLTNTSASAPVASVPFGLGVVFILAGLLGLLFSKRKGRHSL